MGHKVICDWGFSSEKPEYEQGECVKVVYPFIATDTSYNFYADADDMRMEYEGFTAVMRFTMPDHDVKVWCTSRNTMMPDRGPKGLDDMFIYPFVPGPATSADEPEPRPKKPLAEGEWECMCGNVNRGKFCTECGYPRRRRSCRQNRRCTGHMRELPYLSARAYCFGSISASDPGFCRCKHYSLTSFRASSTIVICHLSLFSFPWFIAFSNPFISSSVIVTLSPLAYFVLVTQLVKGARTLYFTPSETAFFGSGLPFRSV